MTLKFCKRFLIRHPNGETWVKADGKEQAIAEVRAYLAKHSKLKNPLVECIDFRIRPL